METELFADIAIYFTKWWATRLCGDQRDGAARLSNFYLGVSRKAIMMISTTRQAGEECGNGEHETYRYRGHQEFYAEKGYRMHR